EDGMRDWSVTGVQTCALPIYGGWSAERDVSLRSGKACADALVRRGYRVTTIDVTPEIAAALAAAKPDVALNVLHGRPGEDGTLRSEERRVGKEGRGRGWREE